MIWLVVPIFLVLLVIDVLLMRRLLAPIVAASHVASSIGPRRLLVRLPTRGLPREVLPLAEAVNEALERLDSALRAQREFTADAAHELRTPLTILRTHVDTMLDGKAALALQNDIDGMSHIVDQLLELAELEGFTAGNGKQIDLNAVCADVVGIMAPIALAVDKSLELTLGAAPLWIVGNGDMLARALRNLVENAIRHSKVGGSIEIELAPPATIRIKDRGPGIKSSERELIFQRFWRRNRQEKGHSGLGLAIVAKIIQLHNGSIAVDDRNGGGAIFTIVLPTIQQTDQAGSELGSTEKGSAPTMGSAISA
jgi:signal transduction histidine kinase